MAKHYKTPPLLEAVCEFKFQPHANWHAGVPDLIYEKVQAQFPRREAMNGLSGEEPAPSAKVKFRRADGSALLQVSPKLLAINQLRPYPTWAQFKQMILEAYSLYRGLARPAGIARLGLRYINLVEIPETQIEISRYLNGCPQGYHKLFLSTEFPFEAEQENLAMILAHVPHHEGKFLRFYLDLDYGAFPATALAPEDIEPILERAHSRVQQVFETMITDEARHLFGEIRKARPYQFTDVRLPVQAVHEPQEPYGKRAPAASSSSNHAPAEASTTVVDSSSAVAFYRERVLELGNKAGHWDDAEAREAEHWENLEMALGVEKDIVFKEPETPTYRINGILNYVGREEPPTYHFDEVEDD